MPSNVVRLTQAVIAETCSDLVLYGERYHSREPENDPTPTAPNKPSASEPRSAAPARSGPATG